MTLGTIVKQLRLEAGLSQRKLAAIAKVNFKAIAGAEENRVTLRSLEKILAALKHELEVVPIDG